MINKKTDPVSMAKVKDNSVTINDIASALGVSKATVSLALNDDPRVAVKTRLKVLEKSKDLGYIYNRGAAGLTKKETRTIGLAVHDITNPYFSEVCAAIEAVLSQNGRMAFLCNSTESIEHQTRFIEALSEYRADGLILCPAEGTTIASLQLLLKQRLPTVLTTRDVEGAELDFVGNNEFQALKLTTEHLITLGHRQIIMIGGGRQTTTSQKRRAGYMSAMKSHGLYVAPEMLIDCESKTGMGEDAVLQVMSRPNPPTAIVCFTDQIALGVLSGLHRQGLKPGQDIAVTGCDDIEEAGRGYIRLTTARIKKSLIGQEAAKILLKRIAEPDIPQQRIVLEPELIIRKSSGIGKK
ncbi:MAG: LacI family DNA-binding transcriptional regulator [Desulfobacterales bacterium]|nr:LacI family DNA-binding transcriptional regulator [Deltaproteobacteria bacterium]NNK92775.1 LacI family DNA-binding transcriptional regulator [Desulfobacterales bacterium]